ncbi:MAG: amidohydrolase family protein [Thermoleophilia bacterium]
MIFDCHTHIFPPEIIANRSRYLDSEGWFARLYSSEKARMASAEGLIEEMDRCGVDRAVACGFAWNDFGLYVETNSYIAEAVARHPDRLIGFANIPPLHPGAIEELERCAGLGLTGVGELKPYGQGYDLADDIDRLRPLAEFAAANSMPLLIHLSEPVGKEYPGKGGTSPRKGYRFARAFPELRLIYAHWGGGLLFYELMPDVNRELGNVYYDCSASPYLYDPDIYRLAFSLPCRDRLLFASDYPLMRLDRCLEEVRSVGLPCDERDALLGDNAAALFGEVRS